MEIRADFSKREVVHSETLEWVASPMPGVDRRALDRVGDEVARATSIVRYAPNSEFSPHVHTGGEEFVVLEGVFQDEHGDFPAGSYIRNPPQSSHKPGSDDGCIIFVKLWQFQMDDRTHVRLQMNDLSAQPIHVNSDLMQTTLYSDDHEEVSLLSAAANTEIYIDKPGGIEILVLEGDMVEQNDTLVKNSWLRLPVGTILNAQAGEYGVKFWMKTGNLSDVEEQIKRVKLATKK
ncbi:cupin domain-containing protein [Brumicola blandensis]|uniref:Cupin domain-containing protein n=1 Tax=Brumicola blandensis TaxID=3075611 RepID=A0AAW8R2N3_9ALTE|nr:cupin domain-containing protein [Alteromonas sp. W409]MDT0582120.1 cupin domain-containing protein [Alteromonas sp. W409]